MMNPRNWKMTLVASIGSLVLVLYSSLVFAYPDYDGCKDCHGGFESNNYVSKTDGARWNKSLMDGHETFVGGKCNACHKSGSKGSVYLNVSIDSSLSKSCVGCHGRQEDVNGSCVGGGGSQVECGGGAGLRTMHELNVGAGTCKSCHSHDPAPVGEQIAPYYYGRAGVQMLNSCDADGTESSYGTSGLDNDGDGQKDGGDSDCQVANSPPTQPGSLSASAVTTNSATVSWGASTDANGDSITYTVEYRRNGVSTWSNAGTTNSTSRSLSGLAAGLFYDVQVTPRDASDAGPMRTTLNLFQTQNVVNSPPTQPGSLSASAVTTNSATVSWGASTDANSDPITYKVEYRRNGVSTWSDGGSTSTTSRSLTGLLDQQFYDVQVTPNDGSENGAVRTALNLFQTETVSQLSCLDMGALAYDDWTKTEAGGSGQLPAGAVNSDYIRCKACHGWDHMGTDGGYSRRSRNAGRPNAGAGDTDQSSRNISLAARNGTNVSSDMILHAGTGRLFSEGAGSWVELDGTHSAANKAANSRGYTLGNQHPDFSGNDLTQVQIDCLLEFLNAADADPAAYFEKIYPDTNPVAYAIKADADALNGEAFYNSSCFGCHGDPATDHQGGNGGVPGGGILNYLAGDGKFSEFAHKARWGIPNTDMSRAAMGSPTAGDVADMMLYLQELGATGFAIDPGLSGNWWGGSTRSGEGFFIDVSYDSGGNTILVVSFYTYDSIGDQAWLIGSGPINGNIAEINLAMPEGALWGATYNPDDRVEIPWGTGTFSFSSCGAGRIALVPNTDMQNRGFTSLEYGVNRDLLIPGVACPTPSN